MEDIPKTVKWLLEFANLGCKQGELNLQSLDKISILKRPPVKPPANIESLKFEHDKPPLPHTALNTITDNTGYQWLRTWGEPVFIGKDVYPALSEFKTFFTKNGLPPLKNIESIDIVFQENSVKLFLKQDKSGKNFIYKKCAIPKDTLLNIEMQGYQLLKAFWVITRKAFISTIREYNREQAGFSIMELKEFVYKQYREWDNESTSFDREGRTFTHDNTLPCAFCAYILDWWANYRELYQCVKPCPCCGSFWIADNTKRRGRIQKYCSEDCEIRFNQQSRTKDNSYKKHHRNNNYKNVKKEIIEWLINNYPEQNRQGVFRFVTKVRANKIYDELSGKAKTSMKEFDRIFKKPKGY
jgi:hypothetical protein